MRKFKVFQLAAAGLIILTFVATNAGQMTAPKAPAQAPPASDWALNATIIEACSCPMFCQCYFNTKPAGKGTGVGLAV